MRATDALRFMIRESGLTATQISLKIGRKENYVSSLLSRGSVPSAETFASIAEACGCQLCLMLPQKHIQIDGWDVKVDQRAYIDSPFAEKTSPTEQNVECL